LDCFNGVKAEDIHVPASFERPKLELELQNDRNFLGILEARYVVPDYQNRYPNIAANVLLKERPEFELFSDTTFKEYHSLFIQLVSRYQQLVDQIAALAQNGESFECILDLTVKTGHTLLTMVKSRSLHLYLSTIAPELSRLLPKDSHIEPDRRNAQERNNEGRDNEERNDEEGDNFEEHDVNAGVELWEPVKADTTTALWKPFKSWIILILAQFQAANALCNFITKSELSEAQIDVKIVCAAFVSDLKIPLQELFEKQYIPQGPLLGPDNNTKLLDFVKTANTLKDQIERLKKLKKDWDPIAGKGILQDVLNEAKKQHQEDSNQGFDLANAAISTLSAEIIERLPLPAQEATILAKITVLEGLLTKRQTERYNVRFSENPTFKGTIHCEAALASILDKTTREGIQARIEKHKLARKKSPNEELYYKKLSTLLADTEVGFNLFLRLIPVQFTMLGLHASHRDIETLLPSVPSFSCSFIGG